MWTLLYHQTFKRRFHILVYLYSQCFYPGQRTSWLGPFFAKNYFETVWLPRCVRVECFQAVPCYGPSLSKGVRPLVADLWEERLRAPDSLGRNIVICTAIFSDILQYCEIQKYIYVTIVCKICTRALLFPPYYFSFNIIIKLSQPSSVSAHVVTIATTDWGPSSCRCRDLIQISVSLPYSPHTLLQCPGTMIINLPQDRNISEYS